MPLAGRSLLDYRAVTAVGTEPGAVRPAPPDGRSVRHGGRRYRVVPPNPRDPRLRQSAVLLSLQVLGQVVLDFELSMAQILLSLGTCALIELVITARRQGLLAWPASALLTGNGVALILRVPGTRARRLVEPAGLVDLRR